MTDTQNNLVSEQDMERPFPDHNTDLEDSFQCERQDDDNTSSVWQYDSNGWW